ncbi:MAG: chemotaxis protein CheX [Candidatus Binatia bacterium]
MIGDQLLIDATREVVETSAATSVSGARPGNGVAGDFDGIIALLSFSGSCPGTLAMLCQPSIAASLAAGMLGMTADEIEEEMVADALGELLNQVGGTVKRKLAADGDEIALSIPSVVSGSHVAIKVLASSMPVAADIVTDRGTIHVRFWMPS